MDLLSSTGVGREINRHYYTIGETEQSLQRPVVQNLLELIRFRNQHPSFNGSFSLPETPDSSVILRWDNADAWAVLDVDLNKGSYSISNSPY